MDTRSWEPDASKIRKAGYFPKVLLPKSEPKNLSTNAALEVILPDGDTLVTTNDISVLD